MKEKTFFISFLFGLTLSLLLTLPILLPWRRGSRISYNEEYRDTVIFNVTYRDTTIYNIEKKDSTIYNHTLVPIKDTVRINDTLYMSFPLYKYRFNDKYAVIYCSGHNVLIDSVNYHFPAVEKMVIEKTITLKPKIFTADAGLTLGKSTGNLYINLDIAARLAIGDKWLLSASTGLTTTGHELSPFAEIGIRRKLR